MWGSHTLKTWAKSQTTIVLSSGETELYAMTKVAVQMKGMMSLAAAFEIGLKGIVRSDSAAAIGILEKAFGIQERVQVTRDERADTMTKAVGFRSKCSNVCSSRMSGTLLGEPKRLRNFCIP